VEYLEFLMNNRPVPHLSFEADAKSGRNVLATLNAITQGVVANFQRAQELHRDVLREVVAA
jgi:hypothetical protein